MEAARKGSALVRQILAFSRKSTSTPLPIDVNREVRQAVEILSRTISKMVEIKPELTAENAVIMGDGSQIQQVLMNLASNAQDAMPAGGVLIIGTEVAMVDRNFAPESLEPGPHLRLSVRDTGQGIDRELVDKVFDPFFTTKGRGPRDRPGPGHGVWNRQGSRRGTSPARANRARAPGSTSTSPWWPGRGRWTPGGTTRNSVWREATRPSWWPTTRPIFGTWRARY